MKTLVSIFVVMVSVLFGSIGAKSQSNEFKYQGSLKFNNQPANGNYDFEFRLFSTVSGGSPSGTQQRNNVAVTNGTFAVSLLFPAAFENGDVRYLEIAVRPAGGGAYTTLTPRELIGTTPYAMRSTNSQNAEFAGQAGNAKTADNASNALALGGLLANQYLVNNDPRLPGGFIQNQNAGAQTGNFNISGNGTIGGNLAVSGNITIPVTTRYINLNGSGFVPKRSGFTYNSDVSDIGIIGTTAGQQILVGVPPTLPDGATITELQVIFKDNDATRNITLRLIRADPLNGPSTGVMASVTSVGASSAVQSLTTSGIGSPIVNNQDYSYFLEGSWTVPLTTSDIVLYSVRVTYTIASPLP